MKNVIRGKYWSSYRDPYHKIRNIFVDKSWYSYQDQCRDIEEFLGQDNIVK